MTSDVRNYLIGLLEDYAEAKLERDADPEEADAIYEAFLVGVNDLSTPFEIDSIVSLSNLYALPAYVR